MPDFDAQRFLSILSGAVGLAGPIDEVIGGRMRAPLRDLHFVGTGGAAILLEPAVRLLQRHTSVPVFLHRSAELVLGGSASLGAGSVVVIASVSGTTRESVEAMAFCRGRGATILALVGHADTPLGRGADHAFVNFAEDDTACESLYLQSLLLALSVLRHRGDYPGHAAALAELRSLPEALLDLKHACADQARAVAEMIASEPYHIIIGAGGTWPQASYYGMCILEEMQWIRTRPVHASDFFHGALELLDPTVSVILFKGEDASRPLAERVERFVPAHTGKFTVLDAAGFALPGISAPVRALISPVILATVLERVSAHLAIRRGHPLTTRRHSRQAAY
jgi:fructoselysine-6-phosphate deglycase